MQNATFYISHSIFIKFKPKIFFNPFPNLNPNLRKYKNIFFQIANTQYDTDIQSYETR